MQIQYPYLDLCQTSVIVIPLGFLYVIISQSTPFNSSLNYTNHAEYFHILHSSPIFIMLDCRILAVSIYILIRVENAIDPDQMDSSEGS